MKYAGGGIRTHEATKAQEPQSCRIDQTIGPPPVKSDIVSEDYLSFVFY